jgi:enoyl-CoA hydratase
MTDVSLSPKTPPPPPAKPPLSNAGVDARRDRALARITLDRPAALNALSRDMKRAIATALTRWGRDPEIYAFLFDSTSSRAFSVGGDFHEFLGTATSLDEALALQAEETRLLWQIETCVKPSVALMDGLVMGFGAGLSMFGTHRVAGAGYSFAMPETAIGYFPDAGATTFLGRMPGQIGVYLGLTGVRVGRADALALGLVTHCIDSHHFDAIRAGLADADPVDPLLDERHVPPGAPDEGELHQLRPAIARCFGGATVEEIVRALAAETGQERDWAQATAATLAQRPPMSLKVTLRQLRSAERFDLKAALEMEYRVAARCLTRPDVQAGMRSAVIDKGTVPRWSPATLSEVIPEMVDAVFAPLGDRELALPPRPASLVALG